MDDIENIIDELERLKYQVSLLHEELRIQEIDAAEARAYYNRQHPEYRIACMPVEMLSGYFIRHIFGWEYSPEAEEILRKEHEDFLRRKQNYVNNI